MKFVLVTVFFSCMLCYIGYIYIIIFNVIIQKATQYDVSHT